ncbi:hypothetical protein FQN55_007515 [Onygenales sp. PD_40]|nr:hypothetical protein FQN55_007515 [Onygenales sp. PD_40]
MTAMDTDSGPSWTPINNDRRTPYTPSSPPASSPAPLSSPSTSPSLSPSPSPQPSPTSSSNSTPESSPSPSTDGTSQLPPAPRTPMPWVWKCHLCRKLYKVGVTNRCLEDGHYFCYRPAKPKKLKKKSRRTVEICTSEFDFPGWAQMNAWQNLVRSVKGNEDEREFGCINDCIYPSSCRHIPETLKRQRPQVRSRDVSSESEPSWSNMQDERTSPTSHSTATEPTQENNGRKRPLPPGFSSDSDTPPPKRRRLSDESRTT